MNSQHDNLSPLMSYGPPHIFVDIDKMFSDTKESVSPQELIASMNLYPVLFLEKNDDEYQHLTLLRNRQCNYGILHFYHDGYSIDNPIINYSFHQKIEYWRTELFHKIYWGKSLEELCRWWINKDTDFYGEVDKELNGNFIKMLKVYVNIDED